MAADEQLWMHAVETYPPPDIKNAPPHRNLSDFTEVDLKDLDQDLDLLLEYRLQAPKRRLRNNNYGARSRPPCLCMSGSGSTTE